MYSYRRSATDTPLVNSIFLTSNFDCSNLMDKLSGARKGRNMFIIPFSRRWGDRKTTLGKLFFKGKLRYIELFQSMECSFEDFDGILFRARTGNRSLLTFAVADIKNIFLGRDSPF